MRETHGFPFRYLNQANSPNRRGPVAIVGIVVVQGSTVPGVANAHVVGVGGVGSAPKAPPERGKIVNSQVCLYTSSFEILAMLSSCFAHR